jgi:L-asparaginase
MDIEPIHILTTGGTIDKIYFDALSDYQVGESVIARLLEIARVAYPFEIEAVMRKDSLELTDADRALIAARVAAAPGCAHSHHAWHRHP